jgi:response regulator RpfG family c-di-GMP phosphodiesterase
MKALEARFYNRRSWRTLLALTTKIATAMGVSERSINDLRLLAQFQDIGKVEYQTLFV